jgi:hypothetical protein
MASQCSPSCVVVPPAATKQAFLSAIHLVTRVVAVYVVGGGVVVVVMLVAVNLLLVVVVCSLFCCPFHLFHTALRVGAQTTAFQFCPGTTTAAARRYVSSAVQSRFVFNWYA